MIFFYENRRDKTNIKNIYILFYHSLYTYFNSIKNKNYCLKKIKIHFLIFFLREFLKFLKISIKLNWIKLNCSSSDWYDSDFVRKDCKYQTKFIILFDEINFLSKIISSRSIMHLFESVLQRIAYSVNFLSFVWYLIF